MFMFQYHMCSVNTNRTNIYPGYISIPISIRLIINKCCYWRRLFVSFVACSVVRLMNPVHVCVSLLLCFHMILLMLCLYRVYFTDILRIYSFLYWENTTSFALWWLCFSVSSCFFFPFVTWILKLCRCFSLFYCSSTYPCSRPLILYRRFFVGVIPGRRTAICMYSWICDHDKKCALRMLFISSFNHVRSII